MRTVREAADLGENYWDILIDSCLNNQAIIEDVDKRYGTEASEFMGRAFQYYFNDGSGRKTDSPHRCP